MSKKQSTPEAVQVDPEVLHANSKYKPEFCTLLKEHMKLGKSFESFGAIAAVTRSTLNNWVAAFPEFADAKSEGEDLALNFYEGILHKKVVGEKVAGSFDPKMSDSTLLIFALKTRFHKVYGEKVKHELEQIGDFKLNYNLDK